MHLWTADDVKIAFLALRVQLESIDPGFVNSFAATFDVLSEQTRLGAAVDGNWLYQQLQLESDFARLVPDGALRSRIRSILQPTVSSVGDVSSCLRNVGFWRAARSRLAGAQRCSVPFG
jgi:hypothetical protein